MQIMRWTDSQAETWLTALLWNRSLIQNSCCTFSRFTSARLHDVNWNKEQQRTHLVFHLRGILLLQIPLHQFWAIFTLSLRRMRGYLQEQQRPGWLWSVWALNAVALSMKTMHIWAFHQSTHVQVTQQHFYEIKCFVTEKLFVSFLAQLWRANFCSEPLKHLGYNFNSVLFI